MLKTSRSRRHYVASWPKRLEWRLRGLWRLEAFHSFLATSPHLISSILIFCQVKTDFQDENNTNWLASRGHGRLLRISTISRSRIVLRLD